MTREWWKVPRVSVSVHIHVRRSVWLGLSGVHVCRCCSHLIAEFTECCLQVLQLSLLFSQQCSQASRSITTLRTSTEAAAATAAAGALKLNDAVGYWLLDCDASLQSPAGTAHVALCVPAVPLPCLVQGNPQSRREPAQSASPAAACCQGSCLIQCCLQGSLTPGRLLTHSLHLRGTHIGGGGCSVVGISVQHHRSPQYLDN
jgi:hypothetical protein